MSSGKNQKPLATGRSLRAPNPGVTVEQAGSLEKAIELHTIPVPKRVQHRILNEQERRFVHALAWDQMTKPAALQAAGINSGGDASRTADRYLKREHVRVALANELAEFARASAITKKKVIDGMIEAIEMAKIQADPLTMISGWREVGKICGFYAPSRAEITLSVNAMHMQNRLATMSDEELLRLTGEDADALDAEFREVTNEYEPITSRTTAGTPDPGAPEAVAVHEDDVSELQGGVDS